MFKLNQANHRHEMLLQWSDKLRQDAQMLESIGVKNEGIKRALGGLRVELAEHLRLLAHSIQRREKRANDQSTCPRRKKETQNQEQESSS